MSEQETLSELPKELIRQLEEKGWWQGSVIPSNALLAKIANASESGYWVIASQSCNIFNEDFEKIPLIELIGAEVIQCHETIKARGENPRVLHTLAVSEMDERLYLEICIHRRLWISRRILCEIQKSQFHIQDVSAKNAFPDTGAWLDSFKGWLARSYNRVALPDEFNNGLNQSRLDEALNKLIKAHHNELYGIYFSIESDSEVPWVGVIGRMPPPYVFELLLLTKQGVDSEVINKECIKKFFDDKIQDPSNKEAKVTRAELARRYDIRILKLGVNSRTIENCTISELHSFIRYSIVDHFSDSTMAAE